MKMRRRGFGTGGYVQRVLGVAGVASGFALPAHAVLHTWDGSTSNNWHTASNWTPAGVPAVGDDAVIGAGPNNDVFLAPGAGAGSVRQLTLSDGARLDTNGQQLNFSLTSGDGEVRVNDGGTLVVADGASPTVPDMIGTLLTVNDGGAVAHAGRSILGVLDLNVGGLVAGSGRINVSRARGNLPPAAVGLVNDGTISAGFFGPGELFVFGTGGAPLDLDGLTGNGVVRATGEFFNGSAAATTLDFDGPLADPFGGLMEIGRADTIRFSDATFTLGPWDLNGELVFRGGDGTGVGGEAARLEGLAVNALNGADVRVDQGTAVVEADLTLASGASLTTADNTTLAVNSDVRFDPGSVFSKAGTGMRIEINSLVAIDSDSRLEVNTPFDLDGQGAALTVIDIEGRIGSGSLPSALVIRADLEPGNDNTFDGILNVGGILDVDVPGTAQWGVGAPGELRLVRSDAEVTGDRVVVAGRLSGTGRFTADVQTGTGQGRLAPGFGDTSGGDAGAGAGKMVWDDAELTVNPATRVEMELGGPSAGWAAVSSGGAHDQIVADELTLIGGTLELGLFGGYLPQLYAEHVLFDQTGPGVIDLRRVFDDVDGVALGGTGTSLAVTYGLKQVLVQRALRGDANLDGFVSQADLDAVLLNWGSENGTFTTGVSWITGDLTGDGVVSQADLDAVLLSWGSGTPPSVNAIPEPTAAGLFLVGAGCLSRPRRRAR